jgi:hypothetical protein
MTEPIPVVYDCMIFLQAAARVGRLHATMQLLHDGLVTLFVCPAVIAELRDVLARPEVTAKFPVGIFVAARQEGRAIPQSRY